MLTLTILIAALVFIYLSAALGKMAGLVDTPGGRKQHNGEIPLVGGVAIFCTVLTGVWGLGIEVFTPQLLWVALIPFAVGVFDDKVHLKPWLRLSIHYGCGILMATLGGVAIHNVGNLLAVGDIPLLALSIPLTALSVAGLCNAYNMIDGIDGLSASLVGMPLLFLYGLAVASDHTAGPALELILIPVGVFLCFNLTRDSRWLPKIFLGDGGSVTLGFMLTAALVALSQGEERLIKPVTALWLVTVPLMDMLATMLRRIRQGRNPMRADSQHLHHILMHLGLSRYQTLLTLVTYAAVCATVGRWLEQYPESLSLLCYFVLFIAHCVFVIKALPTDLLERSEITSDYH